MTPSTWGEFISGSSSNKLEFSRGTIILAEAGNEPDFVKVLAIIFVECSFWVFESVRNYIDGSECMEKYMVEKVDKGERRGIWNG